MPPRREVPSFMAIGHRLAAGLAATGYNLQRASDERSVNAMPLPQREERATAEDYWNLPAGRRAELVDGKLYDMAPPSWIHQ